MPKNTKSNQFLNLPIYVHLLLAIVVLFLFGYIALKGLDLYTRHNTSIVIPDIKGLQIDEAAAFLENNGLSYSVVDSVYTKDLPPGSVAETIPLVGSKVKEGRTIYLTINSKSEETAAVPDVADLSYRQAISAIQSQGFTSIKVQYVSGSFQDLALAVEYKKKTVKPGTKLPISSPLVLIVSQGGAAIDSSEVDLFQNDEN